MGVNVEILRNLQDAEKRHDKKAIVIWQNQLNDLKALEEIRLIKQLPHAAMAEAPNVQRLSKETQRLVEYLKKDGYAVYDYAGRTPLQVKKDGMRFWYLNPILENLSSDPSLLAFKSAPEDFYLRGSQKLPHEKQLELLAQERQSVERAYPSAGLITREWHAPELIDLSLQHLKTTKIRLQGKDFGYSYTWTDTCSSDQQGAYRASVGPWDETFGLDADFWRSGGVGPRLRLAPVVEITRK